MNGLSDDGLTIHNAAPTARVVTLQLGPCQDSGSGTHRTHRVCLVAPGEQEAHDYSFPVARFNYGVPGASASFLLGPNMGFRVVASGADFGQGAGFQFQQPTTLTIWT